MKPASVYTKMRVLGAVEVAEGKSRLERIKKVADLIFIDEEGQERKFTWRTISTWYCRYQKHGVIDFKGKKRQDKGLLRKVTPEEVMEAINQALPFFKKGKIPSKAALYRFCIERGLLRREQIAPNTFSRLVNEFDLLDKCETKKKIRMAFAMPHANDLWQCDTLFGPYVTHNNRKVQSKLIAFIDDASRVICHGQFFPSETTDALMETIQKAFYKRGIPKAIYADNGAVYVSKELNLVCARVGCILRHTPVRDGASKGKIERFFRRVRDQFLIRELDLSSIEALNDQFRVWVEEEYNSTRHSSLEMSPIDRFALDRKRLTFLNPTQETDELFYVEDNRKVRKDNTFSFGGQRYEAPRYLPGKQIQVRYPRSTKSPVLVYYKDEKMGTAELVDLVANSTMKRTSNERRA